eukprot:scaffold164_cov105-Isochrysis_galbana.AAC.9
MPRGGPTHLAYLPERCSRVHRVFGNGAAVRSLSGTRGSLHGTCDRGELVLVPQLTTARLSPCTPSLTFAGDS